MHRLVPSKFSRASTKWLSRWFQMISAHRRSAALWIGCPSRQIRYAHGFLFTRIPFRPE